MTRNKKNILGQMIDDFCSFFSLTLKSKQEKTKNILVR